MCVMSLAATQVQATPKLFGTRASTKNLSFHAQRKFTRNEGRTLANHCDAKTQLLAHKLTRHSLPDGTPTCEGRQTTKTSSRLTKTKNYELDKVQSTNSSAYLTKTKNYELVTSFPSSEDEKKPDVLVPKFPKTSGTFFEKKS